MLRTLSDGRVLANASESEISSDEDLPDLLPIGGSNNGQESDGDVEERHGLDLECLPLDDKRMETKNRIQRFGMLSASAGAGGKKMDKSRCSDCFTPLSDMTSFSVPHKIVPECDLPTIDKLNISGWGEEDVPAYQMDLFTGIDAKGHVHGIEAGVVESGGNFFLFGQVSSLTEGKAPTWTKVGPVTGYFYYFGTTAEEQVRVCVTTLIGQYELGTPDTQYAEIFSELLHKVRTGSRKPKLWIL